MVKELSEEQILRIMQGIKIPPQPQILVDLQMEQVMPDPDMGRIAKLISQDVGLSGTVLKVVNSPFYGLKNRITSVHQAVCLIGLDSVVNIINGLSIKSQMSDVVHEYDLSFESPHLVIVLVCIIRIHVLPSND